MKSALKKASLLCLCMAGSLLSATIQPGPGHFAIEGEYLYWQPLTDQTYYVIDLTAPSTATNPLSGERVDNPFNWQSAYRLEAIYAFCNGCNDIRIDWTYLNSNHSSQRYEATPLLYATQGLPSAIGSTLSGFAGEASSKNHLTYYAVDVLFGQTIYDDCCLPFYLELDGGLQYAHIDFKEHIQYNAPLITSPTLYDIYNHSTFWGIGPELSLEMRYSLSSLFACWSNLPISLTGRLRGALLVSESKASFLETATPLPGSALLFSTDADVHNQSKWRIVPMWDLRFGLSYDWCCGCFDTTFEVGYEVIDYHRAVQTILFTDSTDKGASFDLYSNLDFHGPYVSIGISF